MKKPKKVCVCVIACDLIMLMHFGNMEPGSLYLKFICGITVEILDVICYLKNHFVASAGPVTSNVAQSNIVEPLHWF